MNPIIGTLVNGENNITTNQSFCLVLGLYLAAWKDKQNLYTYLLIGLVFNAKIRQRKERNCPLKRPSISGLFPIFKKSARVGVIQLTLSMDIIQYLAYKKAAKSEATQKSLTPKITATNSMCIFANLSTIGFRLSCKDWSLIAIL